MPEQKHTKKVWHFQNYNMGWEKKAIGICESPGMSRRLFQRRQTFIEFSSSTSAGVIFVHMKHYASNACAHSRRRPFPLCFSIEIWCRKSLSYCITKIVTKLPFHLDGICIRVACSSVWLPACIAIVQWQCENRSFICNLIPPWLIISAVLQRGTGFL